MAQLPAEQADRLVACQAHACVEAFVTLYDLPDTLDLDAFLARMAAEGPSTVKIRRAGNTILWDEQHNGKCMCPLVRRAVVPLHPLLCVCAAHWLRMLIERFAHRPCRVELLGSVVKGTSNCVFAVTLDDHSTVAAR